MLSHLLNAANIIVDLESDDKDEVFEELLETIVASQPNIDRQAALNALLKREEEMSTGIIPGIAIPHAQCASVRGTAVAIGLSRVGIDYDALDGKPVNFIIMLLFAEGDTETHLETMKDAAALLQHKDFLTEVIKSRTPQEAYDCICNFELSLREAGE